GGREVAVELGRQGVDEQDVVACREERGCEMPTDEAQSARDDDVQGDAFSCVLRRPARAVGASAAAMTGKPRFQPVVVAAWQWVVSRRSGPNLRIRPAG